MECVRKFRYRDGCDGMVKALSLQDCYSAEQVLASPDPLVRISAIHHARNRVRNDPALRNELRTALHGASELVARYAAVTLAEAGDVAGLDFLLDQLRRADPTRRGTLRACLRDCTRFPLAALFNEMLALEHIPDIDNPEVRDCLTELIRGSGEWFTQRGREEPGLVDRVLSYPDRLGSLVGAAGQVRLGLGMVLVAAGGETPGFVACVRDGCILQFHTSVVLNPVALRPGSQVLVVWRADDPSGAARLVYILEDRPARRPELLPEFFESASAWGGLRVGVVAARLVDGGAARVRVVFAVGAALDVVGDFAAGRLVLVEPGVFEEGLCHVPELPGLSKPSALAVLRSYARCRGLVLGECVDGNINLDYGRTVPVKGGPGESGLVLLESCGDCDGRGRGTCSDCTDGTVVCTGRPSCPECRGRGGSENALADLFTGRKRPPSRATCEACSGLGCIEACGGSGRMVCVSCDGAGYQDCTECSGTGEILGTAGRMCKVCGGSGARANIRSCDLCGGKGIRSGHRPCPGCGGSGYRGDPCERCGGKVWVERRCAACSGKGSRTCPGCQGDCGWRCAACEGKGRRTCPTCDGENNKPCTHCDGQGLVFHTSVELQG